MISIYVAIGITGIYCVIIIVLFVLLLSKMSYYKERMIKVENNLNYLYNRMNWYQTDLEVITERLVQINKKGAKNE